MVLGEKLWEGKGKSAGAGTIKSVGAEGLVSEYSWTAEVKGLRRAMGMDGTIHVTAIMTSPPRGVAESRDQGIFMTRDGMGVLKGTDLMNMSEGGGNPSAVGLWRFMTMSEKMAWMNGLVALVTFEAQDMMWMEVNLAIYEWK